MDARWFSRPLFDTAPRLGDRRRATGRRHLVHPPVRVSSGIAGLVRTAPFTVSRYTEPVPPPNPAEDDQLVILPAGEVDLATAPLLQKTLLTALDRHPRVCCDLGKVTFFSAAGVTALLVAHSRAIQAGARLTVRRPHGMTRRVLHLTGVEQMLGIDTDSQPHRSPINR